MYTKDKTTKWLQWKVVIKEDHWFLNGRDITEKKEVERVRNYVATIVRQSSDAIYIYDEEMQIISWNEGAEKIYGYSEAEALQMKIWNIIPGYLQNETADWINAVVNGQKIETRETKRITKHGKIIDVLFSASVIHETGNANASIAITERDVTEQKMAEEQLKESESRFRNLFQFAPFPMWVFDKETLRFLEVNETACKVYGYQREEFLDLKITDIRPHAELDKLLSMPEESSRGSIWKHQFKNGELIDVEITSEPLEYKGRAAALVIAKNITERKKAEEKIRSLNEELEKKVANKTRRLKELNERLERRASQLEASNQELERFAFVASHDLQEPLRMVNSFLSLLKLEVGNELTEDAKEYIDYAVDGAERMKHMIQALLSYSRVGKEDEPFKEVDCNSVVSHVLSVLQFSIQESHASVKVHPLPTIKGIESQMQQVFQNLLSNAIKYRSECPVIEIGCNRRGEYWKFFIKDNGIGFDPGYAEKIFVIFQRLHERTQYSGTGIGLSICKKIIEKHGGRIWAESIPGEGSSFYFNIPVEINNPLI